MSRRRRTASVVPVDSRRTLDELSAAVLAVAEHRSVRDVLQTIVGTARSLLDCDYAALGVPDDQVQLVSAETGMGIPELGASILTAIRGATA